MHLSRIIAGSGLALPSASPDPRITAVVHDSRLVVPGALFVCLVGERQDGHAFARRAVEQGAAAIIAERPVDAPGALVLQCPSTRQALAHCALRFAGNPEQRLQLLGITGTNGKTTVSFLLESILRAAGRRPGLIGTLGHWANGERIARGARTTPDAAALAERLRELVEHGCDAAVMEVSSHALVQERVAGVRFAGAAFTCLTRDHLDFHGDMEAYFQAKAALFRQHLRPGARAVINADDPWGRRLLDELPEAWAFSTEREADLFVEERQLGLDGTRARIRTPAGPIELRSPLVGLHNLQNLLCATGLALSLGVEPEAIAAGLAASAGAAGRLERFEAGGIAAFVDYAHTDDALRRVLASLRMGAPRRLLVVFGCGGERDPGKRPLMGEAAGEGADLVVVTSDNPRGEDPAAIVEGILPGLERAGKAPLRRLEAEAGASGYVVELDRRRAIELAVACARAGDAILIAGKGHEDHQIIGTQRIPFDDRDEVRRALAALV